MRFGNYIEEPDLTYETTVMYESSLTKIERYHMDNGFMIISAFRDEYSNREGTSILKKNTNVNYKRHTNLKSDLKGKGLSFFELRGYWDESGSDGIKYKDMESKYREAISSGEKHKDARKYAPPYEISCFVPYKKDMLIDDFRKIGIDLCRKYGQDGIIIKYPDQKDIFILDMSGSEVSIGKSLAFSKISSAYLRLKKGLRSGEFVFEGYKKPSNWIIAVYMQNQGVMW